MPPVDGDYWVVDRVNEAARDIHTKIDAARADILNQLDNKLVAFRTQLKQEMLHELKDCINKECKAVLAESPAMQGLDAQSISDMLWGKLESYFLH